LVYFCALLMFCIVGPVFAQITAQQPGYYVDGRERLDSYLFRTYTDPARIGWLVAESGKATLLKDPHEWGRSVESFSYRVASGWGRRIVGNTVQLGVESVLHEDSRYRASNKHGFGNRVYFAVTHSVLAYKPDGSIEPAYGRIAAGIVTAAVSSTWHPQSIGICALLSGAGQGALDRAGNNLLTEFEPDLTNFGKKTWKAISRK
jgi:hypothetical protein